MATGPENQDGGHAHDQLGRVAARFAEHGVEFVVIGGWSIDRAFPEIGYLTDDLDMVVAATADNYERIAAALSELEVRESHRGIPRKDPADVDAGKLKAREHWRFHTDGGIVDIMSSVGIISGYDVVAGTARPVRASADSDAEVQIADPKIVYVSKAVANRVKDRTVLEALLSAIEAAEGGARRCRSRRADGGRRPGRSGGGNPRSGRAVGRRDKGSVRQRAEPLAPRLRHRRRVLPGGDGRPGSGTPAAGLSGRAIGDSEAGRPLRPHRRHVQAQPARRLLPLRPPDRRAPMVPQSQARRARRPLRRRAPPHRLTARRHPQFELPTGGLLPCPMLLSHSGRLAEISPPATNVEAAKPALMTTPDVPRLSYPTRPHPTSRRDIAAASALRTNHCADFNTRSEFMRPEPQKARSETPLAGTQKTSCAFGGEGMRPATRQLLLGRRASPICARGRRLQEVRLRRAAARFDRFDRFDDRYVPVDLGLPHVLRRDGQGEQPPALLGGEVRVRHFSRRWWACRPLWSR